MKLDLYPNKGYCLALFLCLLSVVFATAQDCSTFTATVTTTESRCTATGTISIDATGGSGNYNYKAVGPVTTTFTSSNVITGLPAGTYTVTVKDISTGCIYTEAAAVVPGTYSDPRFGLTSTDVTCTNGNDGTITVIGQGFGRSPFTYTIVAPSTSNLGVSNSTGVFTNLVAGDYSIQLRDSCGGMQTRIVGILNYSWAFDGVTITKAGCDSADVTVTVKDNKGRTNVSGPDFTGFRYGIIRGAGDTTWSTTRTFRAFKGTLRSFTIVTVDHCGLYHYTSWTDNNRPAIGASPAISNYSCATFTATIGGQQFLTNPSFCIYNSSNVQLECNTNGVFNALPYGSYKVIMTDNCYDTTIERNFTVVTPVPSVNATVTLNNYLCNTFSATAGGQLNIYSGVYRLLDSIGNEIASNSTGVFPNIPYGKYSMTITDGCSGAVLTRTFQAVRPIPSIGTLTTGGFGCSTFNVNIGSGANQTSPQYCLYDTLGNVIACNGTGNFSGLPYGNYCIRMSNLCHDTVITRCFGAAPPAPVAVSAPAISNQNCLTFTAAVTGTNLTNPTVCIYDVNNVLVDCQANGRFDNLAYGTYTIKLTNSVGCYDTTIVRNFTVNRPIPTGGSVVIDSRTCSGFRVSMAGGTNLTSPTYHVFDLTNNEIAANTTGVFILPYGAYEMRLVNTCYDTTIVRSFSATPTPSTVHVTSSASCNIGLTNLSVNFTAGISPYNVQVYNPWGVLVGSASGASATLAINGLPALGGGMAYRVISIDNCGGRDTTNIIPVASWLNKNIITNSKCPSGAWQNGSGDIIISANSSFGPVSPKIIRKDGVVVSTNYSTGSSGLYTFNNMEPANYVIEYTVPSCTGKIYDTFQLMPYAFPALQQSAAYQCDNNSFSVGASVTGGVGPFMYEVIGSYPSSPSIMATPQASPVFSINNGTIYSLIRLRSVDACGNATLNDVSILPLANTIIKQTANCFYNNILLNVDTIPNATYEWFRMTGPNDSISIGSGASYNIPYLLPSDTGMYVAKASVNGGCLTQVSYFSVKDYCGLILSSKVTLNGKKINGFNQLNWAAEHETDTQEYIVERSTGKDGNYKAIAKVKAKREGKSLYYFTDNQVQDAATYYRVRVNGSSNKFSFTNTVAFKEVSATGVSVFPNPVKDVMNISISNKEAQTVKLSLVNVTGQVIYESTHANILNSTIQYHRPSTAKPGVYVLKVNNLKTGEINSYKVMFE
jgi:type IX secretion system substrate protein